MSLGKNIKLLRKARGWDQKALSAASGVAIGTISAIEVRDSRRSEYAPAIARALGVTAEMLSDDDAVQRFLATGKGPPQPLAHLPTREAPTLAQALEALDAALEPLDSQARRIAVGMLAGLETPRNAQMVAAMLGAAIESSKRRAA